MADSPNVSIDDSVVNSFWAWLDNAIHWSTTFSPTSINTRLVTTVGEYQFYMDLRFEHGRYSLKLVWEPAVYVDGKKSTWHRVRISNGINGLNIFCTTDALKRDINRIIEKLTKGDVDLTAGTPDDALSVLDEAPKAIIPVPDEPNKEFFHNQYARLCKWVSTKKPIWAWGAAGGGKSHIFGQIARNFLKLPYYPLAGGPTTTESKIFGFLNAGQGTYVQGMIYAPFKSGGLFFVDEGDVLDPQVLISCNSPLANDEYLFPNGDLVKKHPDFYCVFGANTLGRGAVGGYKRNALDVATLSRFIKVKVEYDEKLEMDLCRNKKWVLYVQKVRKFLANHAKESIMITPRVSYNGDAALTAGLTPQEVMQSTLWCDMSKDAAMQVKQQCGEFLP